MASRVSYADLEKSLYQGCRAWVRAGSAPAREVRRLQGLAVVVGRRRKQEASAVLAAAIQGAMTDS